MNLKFKALKLESINLGTQYAITINPEKQPKKIDSKNLLIWYREQYDLLREYEPSLILYPESSPTGRMHFHGYISTQSFVEYTDFVHMLSKITAGEIDTIDDENNKYKEYLIKQAHIWEEVFNKSVIGYPMKVSREASSIRGLKEVKEKKGRNSP